MKVNFNKPIRDLKGEVIKDAGDKSLADFLSEQLGGKTSNIEAFKAYDWGKKLAMGEELEIDRTDAEKLEKFVEQCETMVVLLKGQLLEIIKEAKNA